jgi:DNA gyrase subunit A
VKVTDISQLGRSTQGVKIMDVAEGDKVSALARMKANKPKPKLADGQASLDLDAVTEGLEEVDLGDGESDTIDEDLDGAEGVSEGTADM